MCSCHSIPECCVMFSGVKLSMGSFVLFPETKYESYLYLKGNFTPEKIWALLKLGLGFVISKILVSFKLELCSQSYRLLIPYVRRQLC